MAFFAAFSMHCQMVLNQNGEAFSENQFFNAQFIVNNKIKKITGTYSFKKDGDLIREVPGSYSYMFDKLGRMISLVDLKWNGKKLDTTVHFFNFNSNGQISSIKKTEYAGVTEQKLQYDSLGRIINITNYRVTIDEFGITTKSIQVNQESFSYYNNKKTTYNSYGLPYLISSKQNDGDGYLISSQEKLKRSGTISTKKYNYNKKGYLDTIKTFYNKNAEAVESISFAYDPFGNLKERLHKKMGTLIDELQLVYDNKTQLLYSIIRRNPGTNFISIIRFKSYEYYP